MRQRKLFQLVKQSHLEKMVRDHVPPKEEKKSRHQNSINFTYLDVSSLSLPPRACVPFLSFPFLSISSRAPPHFLELLLARGSDSGFPGINPVKLGSCGSHL